MSDGDYVLGTRDDEIERLGRQHQVWRPRMLEGFQRAGIGPGAKVLDVGAGPGFATLDLAEIVGPNGRVVALERSAHFIAALRLQAEARGFDWVEAIAKDVALEPFDVEGADASWCRWLLSFVSEPAAVVRHIASALRAGGLAIFHEYIDYSTWRLLPPHPLHEKFRDAVIASWRDTGGEPDIALWLPDLLTAAGMEIVSTKVMADVISPRDFAWQWPRSFMATGAKRLAELAYLSAKEASDVAALLDRLPSGARMLTPAVAEIVALKR